LVGEQGISHKFTDGHILCFVVAVWAASHAHKSSHRGQLAVPIFNLIPPLSSCTGLARFLFLLVPTGAGALLRQTFTGCRATSFDLVFTGVAFPLVLVADSSSVPARNLCIRASYGDQFLFDATVLVYFNACVFEVVNWL
jgi:hypothetical protein